MAEELSFFWKFDPDFSNVVFITSDNRIKIWNIESHRLVVECVQPNHLDAQYTCVSWVQLAKTSKKRARKENVNWNGIALGTQKGLIVVWDINKAEIFKTWKAHAQKVNDVVFSKSTSSLYSCSDDQNIIQWDVLSGSQQFKFKRDKSPVNRLCLSTNETLLASASSIIKVWDLSSKKVSKKLLGHANNVTSLKFNKDDNYLVSSSNDRFFSLWDCSPESDSNQAIQVFTSDSIPLHLDISQNIDLVYILAHTELGTVNLWKFSRESESKSKSLSISGKITANEDQKILGAEFSSNLQISLIYGTIIKPQFSIVDFLDMNGQVITSQTVGTSQESTLFPKSEKKKKAKQQEVEVLDITQQPLPHPHINEEIESQTLEQKLDMMEVEEQENRVEDSSQKGAIQFIPKADSLQSILTQALRTNDSAMLESVLAVSDLSIIRNTVQRLPTQQILPFLKAIVDKFQAKPARGTLILWIQAVLKQHTAYLITVPDLVKTLSGLYLVVDSRLASFKKLLQLSGRLDLLLAQISKATTIREDEALGEPQTVYVDESSSEEEE